MFSIEELPKEFQNKTYCIILGDHHKELAKLVAENYNTQYYNFKEESVVFTNHELEHKMFMSEADSNNALNELRARADFPIHEMDFEF